MCIFGYSEYTVCVVFKVSQLIVYTLLRLNKIGDIGGFTLSQYE